MTDKAAPPSWWRCDEDGETFQAATSIVARGPDGNEVEAPAVDLVIGSLPCPICNGPMRRVVSLTDSRDWEEQVA